MRKRVDTSVAMATVTSGPFLFRTRLNTARGKFESLCRPLPVFLEKSQGRAGGRCPEPSHLVWHFHSAEAKKDTARPGDSEGEVSFPEAPAGRGTECV